MKTRRFFLVLFSLLFITTLTACSENKLVDANTDATPTPPDQDDIPFPLAVITDPDGSASAEEKHVTSGDNFEYNIFERPFTAQEMLYQPDLDILQVSITSDEHFFYFILMLKGVNDSTQTLTGTYGIEFDRSKTGRGDLLVTVHDVTETWQMQNIRVYIDSNNDVGGPNPLQADADFSGDGYDTQLELEGNKVAYASMLPGHNNIIQIAISRAVLDNVDEFLWGAWADEGVNQPKAFDYNDLFNAKQAGSPNKDNENYPLNYLFNLDNTCRQAFGFTPANPIPGSCLVIPPSGSSSVSSPGPSFCCPVIDQGCCSFPDSCSEEGPGITPEPTEESKDDDPAKPAEPAGCLPQHAPDSGECPLRLEAQVTCDGTNDIITINPPGIGFPISSASSLNFTCLIEEQAVTCTGPKQDAGTPLVVEVCASVVPESVPNCKDFPGTFWTETLGTCLPLGSSCCTIGNEWFADEARCIPIITGDGKATQEICGDAYVLVNGYCILKSSLDTCCASVEIPAPCCYSSCATGFILDPATLCCIPKPEEPKQDPCAGVNCDRCCIAGSCPSGCCSCRN